MALSSALSTSKETGMKMVFKHESGSQIDRSNLHDMMYHLELCETSIKRVVKSWVAYTNDAEMRGGVVIQLTNNRYAYLAHEHLGSYQGYDGSTEMVAICDSLEELDLPDDVTWDPDVTLLNEWLQRKCPYLNPEWKPS